MKEFRKTEEGLFICEECGKLFIKCQQLSRHINFYHDGQEKYYDKWLKEDEEGLCKICKNKTLFISFKRKGYNITCNKKCEFENRKNSVMKTIKHYKNEIIEKREFTCINKYGVENTFQSKEIKEKIKQTKKEKYGDEKYTNQDKKKQTCLKKYGVENPTQWNNDYNAGLRIHTKLYKNTKIFYQGSYELDFLEKYYNKFQDIERGPTIKYKIKEKIRVYFPDFFIPSLNIIIECKNSYLVKEYKDQNEAKRKATIANGFSYIMIIDKDYEEFKLFIRQCHNNSFYACHQTL